MGFLEGDSAHSPRKRLHWADFPITCSADSLLTNLLFQTDLCAGLAGDCSNRDMGNGDCGGAQVCYRLQVWLSAQVVYAERAGLEQRPDFVCDPVDGGLEDRSTEVA